MNGARVAPSAALGTAPLAPSAINTATTPTARLTWIERIVGPRRGRGAGACTNLSRSVEDQLHEDDPEPEHNADGGLDDQVPSPELGDERGDEVDDHDHRDVRPDPRGQRLRQRRPGR